MSLHHYLPLLLAQAAQVAPEAARVGVGRIQGGWGYVWTSYGIAFGGIALYAVSLWLRIRKHQAAAKENP